MKTAEELISRLDLAPHPEGGWYREIHRSAQLLQTSRGPRSALTSIYYLLESAQCSRWHTVTSDEIWHFHDGAHLELLVYRPTTRELSSRVLGPASSGYEPVVAVSAGDWQAARTLGDWTMAACDVAPGFDFEDFQLIGSLSAHGAQVAEDLAEYSALI